MNKKLQSIYSFLQTNRKYNQIIQSGEYNAALSPYEDKFDKVYSLLYSILNSQSQLKMDKSSEFFKLISKNRNNLLSAANFIECLNNDKPMPVGFNNFFEVLKKQPGWGDKTAALFVKAIYQTHIGYAGELKFWNDVPKNLAKDDKLYLPVDAVIYFIFETIGNPCKNTFKGINKFINTNAPGTDFEIWDDLWFWGFITQKTENNTRLNGFNEAKYWNLLHSPKDPKSIVEVKSLANDFIKLLNS